MAPSIPPFYYSGYYDYFTRHPEAAGFPRYTGEGAWMLNCQHAEILALEKEITEVMARSYGGDENGRREFRVTDWHPSFGEDEVLLSLIRDYQNLIRRSWKDDLLFHQVANLPRVSPLFAGELEKYPNLIHNGVYGPTGENEVQYRHRVNVGDSWAPHAWAPQAVPEFELTTRVGLFMIKFLRRHIWLPFLRCFLDIPHNATETSISVDKFQAVMDYATCIIVPLFFTAILFCLYAIPSIKTRIAAIGGFGITLAILVRIIARPRRMDVMAICGAFFAFASVFVSVTGSNTAGH